MPVIRFSICVIDAYWSLDITELFNRLRSGNKGLSAAEAAARLREYGPNELRERQSLSRLGVFWNQLRSPLLLLLLFAAVASAFTGEWIDATIVLIIVAATVGIG
jgi:Mg2+-importing ATPase